jgi:hypothetical protein
MLAPERETYIRNHIMGVLVTYRDKGLNYSNMGELADSLLDAVVDGDTKWHADRQQLEDIPQ